MIKIPYKHYTTENKELDYEEIMPGGVTRVDQTKLGKFKEDIKNGNIFPPVEVIQYRHYKEIIEGNHRATAYHLLGLKIPCIIYSQKDMISEEKIKRRKERAEIAGKKRKEIKEAREKKLKEILRIK